MAKNYSIEFCPGDRVVHVMQGEGTVVHADFEYGYIVVLFDKTGLVDLFRDCECGILNVLRKM